MTPFWVSAFVDLDPPAFERGVAFWAAMTGYEVSAPRGDRKLIATVGADGRFRMVEMNQRVADNLERIITALAPGETA